ncbi:MAG: glycerophosphodiester phosphodiesterase [Oleiphilus sp.]|nr:MAG: glycerophosphodiester phosphodiesterase [Oleiphilus sp.]
MIIVGHRGARNEAPENTIESFRHAYEHGCDHFELDVQLSRDHQLVVFHDTSLKRTTGKRGKLSDYDLDELTKLDARQNTPGWPQACLIPSLEQLLDALPDVKHWQFEVKTDSRLRLKIVAQKLIQLIKARKLDGRATLTSSNRWFLKTARAQCAKVSLGVVAESRFWEPVTAAMKLECEYLCLSDRLATPKRISDAHAKGLKVSVWTINAPERMTELAELGIFSIITDVPSMALAHPGTR